MSYRPIHNIPITKNGKWNQDLYKRQWWNGRLVPIQKHPLTPAETKRKIKAKKAKQARKINHQWDKLTPRQQRRRRKAKRMNNKGK